MTAHHWVLHPQVERRIHELGVAVELPAFPAICAQIRKAALDPRLGAREVARLVEQEPTLVLRILKAANSPFFGTIKEVTSAHQAVSVLGMQQVADLAMASLLARVIPLGPGAKRLDPDRFWGHSIAVAYMAGALAAASASLAETRGQDAFTAGLLHDMGKPLMQQYWPVEYARALETSAHEGVAMRVAERRIFGFTHQDMGAWLVDSWGLPRDLVFSVAAHDTPEDIDVGDASYPMVAVVHVANLLVHFLHLGSSGDQVIPRLSAGCWDELKVDLYRVPDLCKATRAHALELAKLLHG